MTSHTYQPVMDLLTVHNVTQVSACHGSVHLTDVTSHTYQPAMDLLTVQLTDVTSYTPLADGSTDGTSHQRNVAHVSACHGSTDSTPDQRDVTHVSACHGSTDSTRDQRDVTHVSSSYVLALEALPAVEVVLHPHPVPHRHPFHPGAALDHSTRALVPGDEGDAGDHLGDGVPAVQCDVRATDGHAVHAQQGLACLRVWDRHLLVTVRRFLLRLHQRLHRLRDTKRGHGVAEACGESQKN